MIVVHAWQPPAVMVGSEFYAIVVAAYRAAGEVILERLAREHPGLSEVEWETRLVEGSAGKAIADVAAVEVADEVIVGTRGAGRLHAMLGGTAQGLLHHAACPVTFIPQRMVEQRADLPLPDPGVLDEAGKQGPPGAGGPPPTA